MSGKWKRLSPWYIQKSQNCSEDQGRETSSWAKLDSSKPGHKLLPWEPLGNLFWDSFWGVTPRVSIKYLASQGTKHFIFKIIDIFIVIFNFKIYSITFVVLIFCCTWAFFNCNKWGYFFCGLCRLFIAGSSMPGSTGSCTGFSSWGTQAQQLVRCLVAHDIWELPRNSGTKPAVSALAGRFSIPPGSLLGHLYF